MSPDWYVEYIQVVVEKKFLFKIFSLFISCYFSQIFPKIFEPKKVIVKGQQFFFPCYEWVEDGFTTAEGKAMVPSKTETEGKIFLP